MKEVIKLFKQIQGTSSTNDKKAIIAANKDNELFKKCLVFLLDSNVTTGIAEKKYDLLEVRNSNWVHNNISKEFCELLDYIKQKNIKCAVFSNKKYENTVYIVNHLFKENTFDFIYGKKEGYPLKPDTRALDLILDELKVKKEEVLYVGDSDVDMKTAINGNLIKVAVTYGYRDKNILLSYNPDYIVSSPLEIKSILEQIK